MASSSLSPSFVTRTPYDLFAKALVMAHEAPFGDARSQFELAADALYGDLAWTPHPRRLPRRPRDVLDRMARRTSLWEFFHCAPRLMALFACLRKQLTWHAQRVSAARAKKAPAPPMPWLWIISSTAPRAVMRALPFAPMKGWPTGFYEGPPSGTLRLVIVRELPATRDTLLLRVMGAGRTLHRAIDEIAALPDDAPERKIALPLLMKLRLTLPDEDPLMKHLSPLEASDAYQNAVKKIEQRAAERALEQGLERGLERGLARGLAPMVHQFSRRLGRPLTDAERVTLNTRLDALGPERIGDVVLDLAPDALAAWLADPDAR